MITKKDVLNLLTIKRGNKKYNYKVIKSGTSVPLFRKRIKQLIKEEWEIVAKESKMQGAMQ